MRARTALSIYLIAAGLNNLFNLGLPRWLLGMLTLAAGILLLSEHLESRHHRRSSSRE